MTLLAPTAAITDLLLALTSFALARACHLRYRDNGSRRSRWWSLSYGSLGLAAFLGFLTLGFETGLERPVYLLSRFSLGIAVLAMVSAVVEGILGRSAARPWHMLFLFCFGAYYAVSLFNASFLIFILYSGTALLATLVLETYRWMGRRAPGAAWMAVGMALSILAAVLQAMKLSFTLIWAFDHNGIYHLVQLLALPVIYRGIQAGDAAERHTIAETA